VKKFESRLRDGRAMSKTQEEM